MTKITAKFPGRCIKCNKAIAVGEWIYWTKATGKRGQAWHEACEGATQQAADSPELPPDAPPEPPKALEPEPEPIAPITVPARPLRTLSDELAMAHPLFPTLLAMLESGANVYLNGAPGAGKSHAAMQAADVLERPYRYISLSPQSMPSLLTGYMDAQGRYVRTGFRDVYEHGGVFCIDEVDNANANLLASLNSALANGCAEFPDAQVDRHPLCVVIATGNTAGNGPTLAFPERRPLDRAFRDRFVFLAWAYAPDHERAIARTIVGDAGTALAEAWAAWVHAVRDYCATAYPALTCSPRAIYAGVRLLDALDTHEVADAVLFQGVADSAVKAKILTACPLPNIERVVS